MAMKETIPTLIKLDQSTKLEKVSPDLLMNNGDNMELQSFITQLKTQPESIEFEDTMSVIDANYVFTPTAFKNGGTTNEAGQNNGSCKILGFGKKHSLSVDDTLACFGKYYREDVLANPTGDDHQNIRHFMKTGWDGVIFEGDPLTAL